MVKNNAPRIGYSDTEISQLQSDLAKAGELHSALLALYSTKEFGDNAREFALQGFLRRVSYLYISITNVFENMDPRTVAVTSRSNIANAEIHLQCFYMNLYGAIDNLAWIFVHEKADPDNSDWDFVYRNNKINGHKVGLVPGKYDSVLNLMSENFHDQIRNLDPWFKFLKSYRDALAHQVPLYIPRVCHPDDEADYKRLANEIFSKCQSEDYSAADTLRAEQDNLLYYNGLMVHSIQKANEDPATSGPVPVHFQILSDFSTLHTLGTKLIEELDL